MVNEYQDKINELEQELKKVNKELEYNKQILIEGLTTMPIELFNFETVINTINSLLYTKKMIILNINANRY